MSLVREDRLIAGVYTLSELAPKLRQMCLLMEKEAAQCTYDDARVLVEYAGFARDTIAFSVFVKNAMA